MLREIPDDHIDSDWSTEALGAGPEPELVGHGCQLEGSLFWILKQHPGRQHQQIGVLL